MNHKPTIPEPYNTSTKRASGSSIGDFDDDGVIDFVDFVKIVREYEK